MVPIYSNTSTNVGVLAPSHNCYTTCIVGTGNDGFGNYTTNFGGTSAACPYAAGAVACLQSAAKAMLGRYLSPAEVRVKLTSTGDPIVDGKAPGITTLRRVNLGNAIGSLTPQYALTYVTNANIVTLTGYTGKPIVVTVPSFVNTIGDNAFANCSSLVSISIANSVTNIGYETFFNCTSLTSIAIPDSVLLIGGAAFINCTQLVNLTIGTNLASIPFDAFM